MNEKLNVILPSIVLNLFEIMQITIASVQVLIEPAVHGLPLNRGKADGRSALNPIAAAEPNP